MASTATVLLTTMGVILGLMLFLWVASLMLRDASIVDPFWGMGFVMVAWTVTWLCGNSGRLTLLAGMTTIWGLRLSIYLAVRNWGKGEDRRYVAMREFHGERFWWVSLLTVFLLQGVLMWFVSLPIQGTAILGRETSLNWIDGIGATVWLIGLMFETIGDWQLSRFKARPENRGRVMDRGLWRYTRHPNYFGDFCVWWGLYLVAVAGGAWWSIGSPLLMSFLLMKVSGVALLEKSIGERRPEYAAYIARTNAFFPGPHKQ